MTDNELIKQDKENAEIERQLNKAWRKWHGEVNPPSDTPTVQFTVGFKMAWEARDKADLKGFSK